MRKINNEKFYKVCFFILLILFSITSLLYIFADKRYGILSLSVFTLTIYDLLRLNKIDEVDEEYEDIQPILFIGLVIICIIINIVIYSFKLV